MIRRPPRSTRTDTLFPYTTLFRSKGHIMKQYKVGYLIGSLAKESINRKLAGALVKLAPENLAFTEISFADLPLYSYDYDRSEEHTSELQSLMRISYAVFCLKNNKHSTPTQTINAISIYTNTS